MPNKQERRLSDFKFKVKVGDLVELNASGKNRGWLYRAHKSIGFVVALHEPINRWDWKSGGVVVRWCNLAPKYLPWEEDFTNRKIPANCIKKVRRKKK